MDKFLDIIAAIFSSQQKFWHKIIVCILIFLIATVVDMQFGLSKHFFNTTKISDIRLIDAAIAESKDSSSLSQFHSIKESIINNERFFNRHAKFDTNTLLYMMSYSLFCVMSVLVLIKTSLFNTKKPWSARIAEFFVTSMLFLMIAVLGYYFSKFSSLLFPAKWLSMCFNYIFQISLIVAILYVIVKSLPKAIDSNRQQQG